MIRRTIILAVAPLALAACGQEPAGDGYEAAASPDAAEPEAAAAAADPEAQTPHPAPVVTVGCATPDQEIFSCQLDNGRQVSVCLAGDDGARQVRYSYGLPGKEAELVLPVNTAKASPARYANVMYSGGGEQQIAFSNGDYRYIVFSRVVRTNFEPGEPNYPAIDDGLFVEKAGKQIAMYSCVSEPKPVDVARAAASMTEERELFAEIPPAR